MVGKRQTKANGYNSRLEALNYFSNQKDEILKVVALNKNGNWFCGNIRLISDATAKYIIHALGLVEIKGEFYNERYVNSEYSYYMIPGNWRLYTDLKTPAKEIKDKLRFQEFNHPVDLTNWANGPSGTDYIISISFAPLSNKWIIFFIK